jgi:signal transduction histidine kinase/DNA-binding NarL/FixJ family response regulator
MSNIWTLLITDDCQEDRDVYRQYLSSDPDRSYRFIEAGSAEVGLALCQKQPPDAILLDFNLPDMTGLEFLDELHQYADLSLPVIMLTGQGDERVAVQAMKRGVRDYLVKSDLAPDVLQLTVRDVIQRANLQNRPRRRSPRDLTAEIALRLHRSLDSDKILETAIVETRRVLECDRAVVYQMLLEPDTDHATLIKRCETGLSGRNRDPLGEFVSFLQGIDLSSPKSSEAVVFVPSDCEGKTYLLAPIVFTDCDRSTAYIWGTLVACQDGERRQWQSDESGFLGDLVERLAIALEQSERLNNALERLEKEKQLNALKSQLVTTVSHEYRSPLAAILAIASTLKTHRKQLPEARQQHFLELIETKARQMARLVDDLLVLEKFESGRMNFTAQPFELLQFVSDLLEEQRQTIGDRHEIGFRITGNTRGFLGDPQLLHLILVNLLANAVKYSPANTSIDVHLNGDEHRIWIDVCDEGIGIPASDRERVFQSFGRGSNVDTRPGTGLGLAIVKACVDLHGGQIQLQSQEGKGTRFTICFPKSS